MEEFLTGLTLFSEMNELSEFILERERTKENDDVLGQIYALLIKSQDIDDVELRKDAVNVIWATLMVHLKNKNMDNNNNG